MKTLIQNPRRLWLAVGGVVAGAALFASGAFAANAVDDDSPDSNGDPGNTDIAPGMPVGSSPAIARPAATDGDASGGSNATDSRMSYPGFGCEAPIPGVLKDGKVDPALAGFAASYLGAAFDLTGFSVRGQSADCKDGTPSGETTIVVDTQWKHRETGLAAYVLQIQQETPQAAVLEETAARFSGDGYFFTVNVNGYTVQPLAADDVAPEKPLLPGGDPRAKDVLRAALADLQAPAEACFYVAREGSWEDLAAAGIGDPRGAIPSGFTLQSVQVTAWTAPAAGCNTPSEGLGINFNAFWSYTADNRGSGLSVSASSIGLNQEKYPGYVGEYGGNWSNGKYQFSVGYKLDPSAGLDTGAIEAIARLLDPTFANACVMREQKLSESELAALGINSPSASGYTRTSTGLITTKLNGDCAGYSQMSFEPQTRAHWQLRNASAVIEVNAYKQSAAVPPEKVQGWISDTNISWTSGSVTYNVSSWVDGCGSAPSRDTLIEVAKSMDPSFDPSKLTEQPGGGGGVPGSPPVKPMPATDLPATR